MKQYLKIFVIVLAIGLIFTSMGIPVGAQEGFEGGTTTTGEGQTLQSAGTNATVPGGPGFVMLHPTAFVPFQQTGEYSFAGGAGALYNPGSNSYAYEAAVNLPHGAKITKVVVYYYDNSSTQDLWVALATINLDTSVQSTMAFLSTAGADINKRVMEDTTITPDTVDNQSNAYWIEVYIPGNQSTNLIFRGVRIDYSYPVNLPLINK